MSKFKKIYLGDGVHASSDGWHVILEGNADGVKNMIFLEPCVWDALVKYHDSIFRSRVPVPEPSESEPV